MLKCTGPAGQFSGNTGLQSSDACDKCPAGKWSNQEGLVSDSGCSQCPEGTYNPNEGLTSSELCLNCLKGTFSDIKGLTTVNQCKDCERGQITDQDGAARCSNCDGAKYTDERAARSCKSCPFGFVSTSKGESCQPNPIDQSLPQPFSVLVLRKDPSTYTELSIEWECAPGYTTFVVVVSTSPIFLIDDTVTVVYTDVKASPFVVDSIGGQDLRIVPHYAKVTSVGDDASKIGAESAPTVKWRNTGTKDRSCALNTQYLNSTSLDPLDWDCGKNIVYIIVYINVVRF